MSDSLSQSDIRSSDIRLSPISLITDIGLSAHLTYAGRKQEKEIAQEHTGELQTSFHMLHML
jgi:hypothetical protein